MEKSQNKNMFMALGTGTSVGVPQVGCSCLVCTSLDHRDQRLRTSVYLLTKNGQRILVDTTPDLRTQLLTNKISAIDFAIITHEHADHLHGFDDLRPFSFGPPHKDIPVYTNKTTAEAIVSRFPYVFVHSKMAMGGGVPRINLQSVEIEKEVVINGEKFFFFNYPHGHGITMGFILDDFAYIVDCHELSDEIVEKLAQRKLKLLVIDCLQRKTHNTHLTVERCFEYIKRIKPERTGLIHISHDLSHSVLKELAMREFGESVFPLYDGQKLFY